MLMSKQRTGIKDSQKCFQEFRKRKVQSDTGAADDEEPSHASAASSDLLAVGPLDLVNPAKVNEETLRLEGGKMLFHQRSGAL